MVVGYKIGSDTHTQFLADGVRPGQPNPLFVPFIGTVIDSLLYSYTLALSKKAGLAMTESLAGL